MKLKNIKNEGKNENFHIKINIHVIAQLYLTHSLTLSPGDDVKVIQTTPTRLTYIKSFHVRKFAHMQMILVQKLSMALDMSAGIALIITNLYNANCTDISMTFSAEALEKCVVSN